MPTLTPDDGPSSKAKQSQTTQASTKLQLKQENASFFFLRLRDSRPFLGGEKASAPCCPDLVLGELAEGLGLHDDGHRGELALAQDLEVAL